MITFIKAQLSLSYMIRCVQSIRVPPFIANRIRGSSSSITNTSTSSNPTSATINYKNNKLLGSTITTGDDNDGNSIAIVNSSNNNKKDDERNLLHSESAESDDSNNNDTSAVIYWISGLEHVFLEIPGDSCADSVRIMGYKPPRYIWYMISGCICDVIQFLITYVLLHLMLSIHDASLCWMIGFTISIVFRHTMHRYFVFGNYVGGYYNSLYRMYGGYSIIIVLSTIFNKIVSTIFSFSFTIIFVLTILWTGKIFVPVGILLSSTHSV